MITCDLTNYNGRLLHHEETLAWAILIL
jgi:hypothetical protein